MAMCFSHSHFSVYKEVLDIEKLSLYTVNKKYVRDLHNVDDRVLSVSPQINKDTRVFIGIIVMFNDYKYLVPLSHPKDKHQKMRTSVDFEKIYYKDKLIAVLNYNLMIPVVDSQIKKFDFNKSKYDSIETIRYKELCKNELAWCRKNSEIIINKANVLYNLYLSEQEFKARSRCLNFPKLEKVCDKYKHKNDS